MTESLDEQDEQFGQRKDTESAVKTHSTTCVVEAHNAGGRTGVSSLFLACVAPTAVEFSCQHTGCRVGAKAVELPGAVWMGCMCRGSRAITPATWQWRNPSAETRPPLKCELCHFSILK